MPETKFGPLSSLVGRTFERDGKRRTVTRVELWTEDRSIGNVYWARPGMKERTQPIFSSYFETWLRGATEVYDGQG